MKPNRVAIIQDINFNTREDNEELRIEGYFSTFKGTYPLWDGAYEMVDSHAFDDELNKDVRALINHDTSLVLGRTTAGTLSLSVDENGLYGSVLINPKDQDAMNLYERVKRGDVNQCSFGFNILDQEQIKRDDGVCFLIRKVELFEVSVCTFPAYQDTAVLARRRDFDEAERMRLENKRDMLRKKLKGVNDVKGFDVEASN